MRYYYFVVCGGTEMDNSECYPSPQERDAAARKEWKTLNNNTDNIFWCDILDTGFISQSGPYLQGDLDDEEEIPDTERVP